MFDDEDGYKLLPNLNKTSCSSMDTFPNSSNSSSKESINKRCAEKNFYLQVQRRRTQSESLSEDSREGCSEKRNITIGFRKAASQEILTENMVEIPLISLNGTIVEDIGCDGRNGEVQAGSRTNLIACDSVEENKNSGLKVAEEKSCGRCRKNWTCWSILSGELKSVLFFPSREIIHD